MIPSCSGYLNRDQALFFLPLGLEWALTVWSAAKFLALLVGSVLAIGGGPTTVRAAQVVDLELILAVDNSSSVDSGEARLQRDGYVAALVDPQVIAAIRSGRHGRIAVAYVEWAGMHRQSTVAGWALIENETSARAFARTVSEAPLTRGSFTSISAAIEYAIPLFAANGFEGKRRVIDISGDGPNNSGRLVTEARAEAIAAGITINGLPIIDRRQDWWYGGLAVDMDEYFKRCVIGGPGAFIEVAKSRKSFTAAVRRKLIREIYRIVDRPRNTDPENGRRRPRYGARSGDLLTNVSRPVTPRSVANSGSWRSAAVSDTTICDVGERRRIPQLN